MLHQIASSQSASLFSVISYASIDVNSITTKANGVLGFIRLYLYSCPQDLKSTAYQILVRRHLEYSPTVWDTYT